MFARNTHSCPKMIRNNNILAIRDSIWPTAVVKRWLLVPNTLTQIHVVDVCVNFISIFIAEKYSISCEQRRRQ